MAERGTGHYRQRHRANSADRERVQGRRRWKHLIEAVEAEQQQAEGQPAIADMQDEQQRLSNGAVAAPDSRSATAIPATNAAQGVTESFGAIAQVTRANPVMASTARSKRPSDTGGETSGRTFVSQLCVKLGMIRPPTSEIIINSVTRPRRLPSWAVSARLSAMR